MSSREPDRIDEAKRRTVVAGAVIAATSLIQARKRAEASSSARYDVIVVGGGTTGIPLALAAADRAARVLIVEKAPILGGTMDRSAASTSAAGTSFQRAEAIQDTAANHFTDIMRSSMDLADPILVRLWTDNAAEAIAWLLARGVNFKFTHQLSASGGGPGIDGTYRIPRVQMIEGQGKALFSALEPLVDRAVQCGRLTVQLSARAVELIQDDQGVVTGLVIEHAGGELTCAHSRHIVLTSGGCIANPGMYQELQGVPLYWHGGYPFNEGDGLMLGQSVGGYVRGGAGYVPLFGIAMAEDAIPSMPAGGSFQQTTINSDVTRPPWEIWVNASGQRFVAEDSLIPEKRERALGQQHEHRMWAVHDEQALEKAPSPMLGWHKDKYLAAFDSYSMFFKAPTLHQLALKAGINPRGLTETVASYNSSLTERSPDRFGRTHRPAAVDKSPFYAVRYQGYHLVSFAGLAVDHKLRVVRTDGKSIPNLYAAGEILGGTALGTSGHAIGSMVTPAIALGLLLGRQILEF